MIFRSFRLKVIIRIALIGAVMGALVYSISQAKWYVASGVSAVLILILLIELFYFIDRSNRDLQNLLLSLKHKDFTQSVATRFSEKSFRELQDMFSEIRNVYRDASIEREVHFRLFGGGGGCSGKDAEVLQGEQHQTCCDDRQDGLQVGVGFHTGFSFKGTKTHPHPHPHSHPPSGMYKIRTCDPRPVKAML